MVLTSVIQALQDGTESGVTFVCPLCGTTLSPSRQNCWRCGGNLVVPVEESDIYETVVPMCGPDCRPAHLQGDGNGNPQSGDSLLSRLRPPSDCSCRLLDREGT